MRLDGGDRQANPPPAGAAGVIGGCGGGHDHMQPAPLVTGRPVPAAGCSMLARVAPTALHDGDLEPVAVRLAP